MNFADHLKTASLYFLMLLTRKTRMAKTPTTKIRLYNPTSSWTVGTSMKPVHRAKSLFLSLSFLLAQQILFASQPNPIHDTASLPELPKTQAFYYTSLARKIDPRIHEDLLDCAPSCFRKASNGSEKAIIIPNEPCPLIALPLRENWFLTKPEDLADTFRAWYEIYRTTKLPELPKTQAFYYTSLAREIDPRIHQDLLDCAPSCFREASNGSEKAIIIPNEPCPLIALPLRENWFLTKPEDLADTFRAWYEIYRTTNNSYLREEERNHFLEIIREIAPKLYDEFAQLGEELVRHFKRHQWDTQCEIKKSKINGLPLLIIGSHIKNQPAGWQKFVLGHELSHYALGHPSVQRVNHRLLETPSENYPNKSSDKKPLLNFETTFKKAQNRIREHEADRFSILQFETDPDAAICWVAASAREFEKSYGKNKNHHKETFRETHPADGERIKHLRSLKKEIELQKAYGIIPEEPDWKALAQEYQHNL